MQSGLLVKKLQEMKEEIKDVVKPTVMDSEYMMAASRYIINSTILPLKFIINTLLWDWSDGSSASTQSASNPLKASVNNLILLRKLTPQSSMDARIKSSDFGLGFHVLILKILR
jgi:hypothetical protein